MKTLKIYFAILFAALSTVTVFAHDFEVDGIYYNKNADGTRVTVTFRGNSYNAYYDEYSGNVVIPSSVTYSGKTYAVTSIGERAFSDCKGLTSISIPKSVTSIGVRAFSSCSGLTTIVVESGNTVYDSRNNCNAIVESATKTLMFGCKNTTIPNSVTSIGDYAFSNCSGLTSISIPNSVTSIGEYAFCDCSGLTSITIPNAVTSIGFYAFSRCKGLTSISIPKSVTSIGERAFISCPGLTTIVVESGNTVYDSRNNCNAIVESATKTLMFGCKNTTIPNSVTSIGYSAFSYCSGLTSISIPNSVTSIGNYAFELCSDLTSVTIGNSVTSIGDYAFSRCSGLTSISIPNSVTSIGGYAFSRCSGLTSISIPNSVTSIGGSAFSDCSGLTSVIFNAENCNDLSHYVWPSANLTSFTIGDKVQRIPANLCKGLSKLTSITIPNAVTSIGNSAFYNCSGLTSITIPNAVTSIGNSAFSRCSGLTSISIPNSVTSIGGSAFSDCSGLTSVIFNAENCNDLSEVWPSDNLTSFTIGDKVQRIPANLCYGLSKLTSISIPNSVTSIGEYAFYECRGLTSVTIGNSVTSIGEAAFWFCIGLNLLKCDAVTPPSLGSDVFGYVNKSACQLVVPDQSINLYKAAEQWKDFLTTSDAEMVPVDESGISVENGAIVNRSNQQIDVYSISGAKAYSGNDAEITLPSGIYVVKVGEKVVKLTL